MSTNSTLLTVTEYLKVINETPFDKAQGIVTGNESADLDSVISALIYSYFAFILTDKIYIPIINIPRNEIYLRKDIVWLLQEHGITDELLFFADDLNGKKGLDCILVDHNDPQGLVQNSIGNVVGIIDHHADSGKYREIVDNGGPRLIAPTGSCCSHVLNYWMEKASDIQIDRSVAQLCVAAIVQDTSNMKKHVEPTDEKALDTCLSIFARSIEDNPSEQDSIAKVTNKDDIEALYNKLHDEKSDIKGFTMEELLRRDYKFFTLGEDAYPLGISSTSVSISWLMDDNDPESMLTTFKEFISSKGINSLIVSTSFKDEGTFRRQLLLYPGDSPIKDTIIQLQDSLQSQEIQTKPELQSQISVFNLGNTKVNRKTLVPMLRETYGKF